MERTPEMDESDLVRWLLSNKAYRKAAKKRLDVYNVDVNDQRLSHALRSAKVCLFNVLRSGGGGKFINLLHLTLT